MKKSREREVPFGKCSLGNCEVAAEIAAFSPFFEHTHFASKKLHMIKKRNKDNRHVITTTSKGLVHLTMLLPISRMQ